MFFHLYVLSFNLVKIPFDAGANKKGSALFPDKFEKHFVPFKSYNVDTLTVRETLGQSYINVWDSLLTNRFTCVVGGDHTVAIPSIFAANTYCSMNYQSLGILWMDAHADFNTYETSVTKNLHGMPVAALCGHTLSNLCFGTPLEPSQFAYLGLRDMDSLEFLRLQEHNMTILDVAHVSDWMKRFDKIHISFDVDCLDPTVMPSVNTPVPNGLSVTQAKSIIKLLKDSGKMLSMDIVEFNPTIAESSFEILKFIFEDVFN
jgi:arginase